MEGFLKVGGEVVDVYIPLKRNKSGRRFGFVRFMNNGDPEGLEKRLGNIWIGTYKLSVNISRFARNERGDVLGIAKSTMLIGKYKQ